MKSAENRALLLIDVQKGFLDSEHWGLRNNPDLEENIAALLETFRAENLPVIHVQHHSLEANSPLRPNQGGVDFMDVAMPVSGEMIFAKNVNSTFIGTTLERHLRDHGITELALAGLTSDHCVWTSARMAANLGFKVTIIEDAVATFDRVGFDGTKYSASLVHDVAIASLKDEFAIICSTRDLIKSMTGKNLG